MKTVGNILFTRPRLLNVAHRLRLAEPTSQTTADERKTLARYAEGAACAVEIGTYQGVSAVVIARALDPAGRLWCVDPWPASPKGPNACLSICRRHFQRAGVSGRIRIVRRRSSEATGEIPASVDFAFIDGDHSWAGIDTDWKVISPRVRRGGHVCLHDSVVPAHEPWRSGLDSSRYFEQVIRRDSRFEVVETIHSLAVVRRL